MMDTGNRQPAPDSLIVHQGVNDLAAWLRENGVADEISEKFEDQEIDGESFLELTEQDVKEMVKPLGVVKKILRLQKSAKPQQQVDVSPQLESRPWRVTSPGVSQRQPPSQFRSTSPFSPQSPSGSRLSLGDVDTLSLSSAGSLVRRGSKQRNFAIPLSWRPSIMECIKEERLEPEIRNEIVRDLVTHMYAHVPKPDAAFCKAVASMLVNEYNFMADSAAGPGEELPCGSWVQKLVDRVYNVEKCRKRKRTDEQGGESPRKRGRPKKKVSLESRYPTVQAQGDYEVPDEVTNERSMSALKKEMSEKEKPRKEVVLPLMKTTFYRRRLFVVNGADSVASTLEEFPALKMPAVLEQEMELVLNKPTLFRSFSAEWQQKWAPAIKEYCARLKRKEVQQIRQGTSDGQEEDEKCSLKLVCTLLSLSAKKPPATNPLCYIYEKYKMTDDPEEIASQDPPRNAPRIGEFEVDNGEPTYFIFIEQSPICSVSTFTRALFLWFICHYVFNLEYDKHVRECALFFQEFLFGLPSNCKKTSTYLSVTTDIQKHTSR